VDDNGIIHARTIETIQSVIKRMFIHTGAELHYQLDAITITIPILRWTKARIHLLRYGTL